MVSVGSVEIGLKLDKAQYYADLNAIKKSRKNLDVAIVPSVDHRPLTALNRHIDLKIRHLKELRREARKPIVIEYEVNTKEVEQATRKVSNLNSEVRQVVVNSNVEVIHTFSPFTSELRMVNDSIRSLIAVTKAGRSKRGVLGAVGRGVEGVATAPFKVAGNITNKVVGDISRGLLENLGKDIGKSIKPRLKSKLKQAGVNAGDEMGDTVSIALVSLISQISAIGSGVPVTMPDKAINTFIKDITWSVETALDPQKFKSRMGKVSDELLQAYTRYESGQKDFLGVLRDLSKATYNANKRQAHNALLRTLQVGSIPMNIRKEVELFRAARRIENTQTRKVGGFTSPKYQKYAQDPNLQGKENVIFTIGGFQRQSGKSGDTLASQLTPFINPDNTVMMPVRNTFMDKRRGHKEGDWAVEIAEQFKPIIDGIDPTLFPIIEKQLRGFGSTADNVAKNLQSFVRGVNPDAERLAGINYAIQRNNPDLKAGAVGFSGGGYPVEQAVRLSEILGTPMTGAGLGVPLTGLTPSAKTGQFKGFLHQYDTLAMAQNPEWMNLSESQQKTVFNQAVKGEGETPGMAPEMAKLATEFGLFNPQATQVNITGRRTSPGHDVQSYLSAPEVRQELSIIPGLNFNQFQDNQQLQDPRFNRIAEAGKIANTSPMFPETLKSDVAIAELTKFGKAIREVRTRLEELDQRLNKSLTGRNYDEIINIVSGADSLVENNQRLEEQFGSKKEKRRLQNLAGQLYDETLKTPDTEKYGAKEAEKLKKQFLEDWKALFNQQGWVQEGKAVLEASQKRLRDVADIIAKKEGLDPSKYTQDPKGQLAILNFLTKHMSDNPKVQRGLEFMTKAKPTTQAGWEFYRPGANSRVDWDLDQYIEKGLKPMVATLPQEVKKTGEALIKYLRSIQVAMSQNIASGTPIPQEILDTSKQILTSKDVFAENIPNIDIQAKQATLKTNLEQAKGQSGLGEAELSKIVELNRKLQAQYPNDTPFFDPKDMVVLGKGQNSRALLEKSTGRVVKYGIRGNQDESFINEATASQELGDIAYNVPKEQVPGFLISEIAEGNTVRDLLSFANSIKDVEDDIKAMGKALRKIHEAGRTHDDFHIGNLVKTSEGFKAIDLAGSEKLDGINDKAKLDRDRLRAIEHSKGILQYDILDKAGKPKINPSDFEKLFIEGYYGKKQGFSHISPSSSYLPKEYQPKNFAEENRKAIEGRQLPKEYKSQRINLPVEIKSTETVTAEIVKEQQGLKTAIQATKKTLDVVNQTGQMVGKGFNDTVSALMPVISTIYKLDQASKKVITTIDPTGLSKLGIKSAEMLMPAIGFAALTHGTPVGQLASGAVGSVVDPAVGMGGQAITGSLTEIVSGTMGNVPLVGNQISLAANQAILEIVQGITQVLSGVGTEVVTNLLGGQVIKTGIQKALSPVNTESLKALPASAQETVQQTEKLIKGFKDVVKVLKTAEASGDTKLIGTQVKAINRYLETVYKQLQEAKAVTKSLPGNDYKRLIGQQRGLTRQVNQQREKYPEIITIDTTAYTVAEQPAPQKALAPSNDEMKRLREENEVLKKQIKSLKDVKPGQAHTVNPKQLSFNPKSFQFKGMVTDLKTGSTNSLAGITKENWNKELGGVISYWVDELGEIGEKYKAYVINGHNRVSKAIDLEIAELNAIRIEAKTAKEARGKGAIQNIIDDKGTPLDAARAFKDLGITSLKQAANYGVPKKTKTAKDAIALLQLPDWIFSQVSQGMIDLKDAVNIGNERLKSNPLDNDEIKAVYDTVRKEIDKTGEASALFIRKYADLLRESRQQIETQQGGLFGDFFSQNSEKIQQKASTLAYLEKNISAVARKNKSAAKDAKLLEVGGNLINKEQSKKAADKYKNLLEVIRKLNGTKSEVSKLINRAVDLKIEGLDEGEVNRSLTNLLASFAPLLSKGVGDFSKVGDDVIAGLTKGLKDSRGRLDKTTIELAKSLPENVKRVLGIASPSKVFLQIGRDISRGLQQGLSIDQVLATIPKDIRENVKGIQQIVSRMDIPTPQGIDKGAMIGQAIQGNYQPRNKDTWEDLQKTIKSASSFSQDYLSMASPGIQNFIQGISAGTENFIRLGRIGGTAFREIDNNIKAATNNTWSLGKAATVTLGAFSAWRGLRFLTEPLTMGISNLPYDLYQAARAAQDAQLNMARLEVVLDFSGVNASTELARISEKADDLGVSFLNAADGYSALQAAALNTPIAPQVPMLSDALMTLYATRQLDPQSQEQANRAFSQIIGKQKLYAEEIQQQLNESIPGGVTGQMARAYGQTQQEFLRSVRNTGVQSEDLLPRFAVQVEMESAAGVGSLKDSPLADFARLSNQAERLQINFGEKLLGTSVPAVKVFNSTLDALNDNFDAVFIVGSSLVVMIGTSLATAIIKASTFFKTGTIATTAYSGALKLAGVDTFKLSLQTALLAEKLRIIPGVSVKASLSLASVATNGMLVMKGLGKVASFVAPWLALGFTVDGVFKVINAGNEELKQTVKSLREIEKATPTNPDKTTRSIGRQASGNAVLDFVYAPPVETPWWQTAIPGLPLIGQFNNAVENLGRGRDLNRTDQVIETGQNIIDNSVVGLTPEKITEVRKGLRDIRGEIELTRALQGKATKAGDIKTALGYDQKLAELSKKEVDFIKENLMPLTKLQGVLDNLKKAREALGDSPQSAQQAKALDAQITQVQGKIDQVSRALQGLDPEYRKLLGTLGDVRREYVAVGNSAQRATQVGNIELNTQFVAGEINPYELTEGQRRNQKQAFSEQVKESEELAQQLKDRVFTTIDSADNKTLSTQIGEDFLQGIESGELNPRVLEDLMSNIANEEGRELSQNQETAIKAAIQYLEIQRDILGVREQISGLDAEQTRADRQRVQDLRGFYKTVIDFDRQLQDFQRDTERQLIDFERSVSDFNREQFRSFRGLAEQWDDLYRSIDQQTLAAINQIEATQREIESIELQTRFTRLNPQGFDNPLQAFSDAVVAIRTSFNRLQGETDKRNESRLQIETDTINIARQVRGLQEQQEDLERQRLVQLEQFRRQQQDFERNQSRTWQDILFRAKDIETQAYQLGVSMDAVGDNVTEQGNALAMSIHELAKRINGSIESFPVGGTGGYRQGGVANIPQNFTGGLSFSQDVIQRGVEAAKKFNTQANMCAASVKAFTKAIGINSSVMDLTADSAKRMGTVMTDFSQLKPGDLIGWSGGPRFGDEHIGMYMGGDRVFHQSGSRGLKPGIYNDLDHFKKQKGAYFVRIDPDRINNQALIPQSSPVTSDAAYRGGNPSSQRGSGVNLSSVSIPNTQNSKTILNWAKQLFPNPNQFTKQESIAQLSSIFGINPVEMAALMSFESAGTMSPHINGGDGGKYKGLIQFGPPEQRTWGVNNSQSFQEQALHSVLGFLVQRGLRRGMGVDDAYAAILTGNVRGNRNSRDSNGTNVNNAVRNQFGRPGTPHYDKAAKFMEGITTGSAITTTNQPIPVYQPSPVTIPDFNPVTIPTNRFRGVTNFQPMPIAMEAMSDQQSNLNVLREQQLREQQTRDILQFENDTTNQSTQVNRGVRQFILNSEQTARQFRDFEAGLESLRDGTILTTTAQQKLQQELRQNALQFQREIESRKDAKRIIDEQLEGMKGIREEAEKELRIQKNLIQEYELKANLTEQEKQALENAKTQLEEMRTIINDTDLSRSIESNKEISEELGLQIEELNTIKELTDDRIRQEAILQNTINQQRAFDDLSIQQVQLEDSISGNPFNRSAILQAELEASEIYIQQKVREAQQLGIVGEALTQYEQQLRNVADLKIENAFIQANPFIQQFEQNLTDVLLQVRSIEDAALALFRTIASEVIKVTIARPIARMVGGVFGSMFGTGGILGFNEGGPVGDVPNLAKGGMVQNLAMGGTATELGMNAIVALQREKVMGGGTPVLAALTEGEYVVPRKEVPAYMSYKRQQIENRNMQEYAEVKNFARGGPVGNSSYRGSSSGGTGKTYVINTSNNINLASPNQLGESMEQLELRREEEEDRIRNRFG